MQDQEEQWVQSASGFWVPKQQGNPKKQHLLEQQTAQKVQLDPEPGRDWKAYWETRGQAWRGEPEIDQEWQQFLLKQLAEYDEEQARSPFRGIALSRADIEWLVGGEQRKALNLREAVLDRIDLCSLPLGGANFRDASLKGAKFRSASLEGANFFSASLKGANFFSASLKGAKFRSASLEGADFRDASLEGADFGSASLEGADFGFAELKGARFVAAKLKGADFVFAKLEGATFRSASLEGANFFSASLEGANFFSASLEGANFVFVKLEGVDLRRAHLEKSNFEGARLADLQGVGPRVADAVGWEAVYLAAIQWSQLRVLGDEVEAQKKQDGKGKEVRLFEYSAAVRAYRQLATALEGQGLKEEAERFAYRAQVMQRKVWWWSMWQEREEDQTWRRFLGQCMNGLGAYLFSSLLALLTGYGYRFGRSLVSYLCVLVGFALLYWHISQGTKQPLEGIDALILSISDMVGRGFFRQDMTLPDPYAGWSVLEGMIGVFMDVLLISTLTQRLFKK